MYNLTVPYFKTIDHILKCVQPHFHDVCVGLKTFEIRRHDRLYEVGDIIILAHYGDDYEVFTGLYVTVRVKHILDYMDGLGIEEGYCILSIEVIDMGQLNSDDLEQAHRENSP